VPDRRTRKLIRTALDYVNHGWPVCRIAVPRNGHCPCPLRTCIDPHLMLKQPLVISTTEQAQTAGSQGVWSIALVTKPFDVFEVPAAIGAPLHNLLKTTCPTAFLPATKRWQFFVAPDSIALEVAQSVGGDLVSGASRWVPAPGTWTEATSTTRWLVPPYMTHWTPYVRRDPIDIVIGAGPAIYSSSSSGLANQSYTSPAL
jgi:hypothetical protein